MKYKNIYDYIAALLEDGGDSIDTLMVRDKDQHLLQNQEKFMDKVEGKDITFVFYSALYVIAIECEKSGKSTLVIMARNPTSFEYSEYKRIFKPARIKNEKTH